ncbi:MAG: NAD-dependent epimerase/dehydratase family protein [Defluviitaleaceae bacterium]|nr:NAD-dependent epimerase/dehydratase family protein [Defluviitaleaceae bacterium]
MTVLVTGGAGFIGSFVVESYLMEGYSVVVVDNYFSGAKNNLEDVKGNPSLTIYDADIKTSAITEIIAKHKPKIINHHAAQKSIPNSIENPTKDAAENVMGLLNILSACKENPIETFLYISSGGALSNSQDTITEDTPPGFSSPYAITKYAGENYVKLYSQLCNYSYTILRYGNIYGPRQVKEGECGVIPIFVENTLNKSPSQLFTYPDMPKGCVRDYAYVKDVAQANILATKNPINDTINISSGTGIYIKDIYESVQKAFGTNIPLEIHPPRQNDVKYSVLSNEKAKRLLGWSPKTTLEQGLREIYDTTIDLSS